MLAQVYGYVGVEKGALTILECTAKVHENMQMPRYHSKSIGCFVTIDQMGLVEADVVLPSL